jgi:hypothetical protein
MWPKVWPNSLDRQAARALAVLDKRAPELFRAQPRERTTQEGRMGELGLAI